MLLLDFATERKESCDEIYDWQVLIIQADSDYTIYAEEV
jgi:hypothetical protein